MLSYVADPPSVAHVETMWMPLVVGVKWYHTLPAASTLVVHNGGTTTSWVAPTVVPGVVEGTATLTDPSHSSFARARRSVKVPELAPKPDTLMKYVVPEVASQVTFD